jgi:hypothetical protein
MPPVFPHSAEVGFPEGNQVLYASELIRHASGHSRGRAKCTMNLDEIKVVRYHRVWSLEEIVMMADNYLLKPGKRGPYKRRKRISHERL